jgi:hypothetical protein
MLAALDQLEQRAGGVLLLLLIIGALLLAVHWLAWIFGWGRFRADPGASHFHRADTQAARAASFVLVEAGVKVINEFRHLLALVVVSIFAAALAWVLFISRNDPQQMGQLLQTVAASLGGLVGSIIGYYFGESNAAAAAPAAGNDPRAAGAEVQRPPDEESRLRAPRARPTETPAPEQT